MDNFVKAYRIFCKSKYVETRTFKERLQDGLVVLFAGDVSYILNTHLRGGISLNNSPVSVNAKVWPFANSLSEDISTSTTS